MSKSTAFFVLLLCISLGITGCISELRSEHELLDVEIDEEDESSIANSYTEELMPTIMLNDIVFNLDDSFNPEMLELLKQEDLAYFRNAIYAKYGYVFKNQKYRDFFKEYSWYSENDDFSESDLMAIDQQNIKLILELKNSQQLSFKHSIGNFMSLNSPISREGLIIKMEDMLDDEDGNNSRRIIMTSKDSEVIYESTWNDGLFVDLIDFDTSDDYLDIYIIETGTDISCRTYIYRYVGHTINLYGSFEHFGGEFLYDEKGKIYYWFTNLDKWGYDTSYDYGLNKHSAITDDNLLDVLRREIENE